jgi:hypothetical protein
VTALTHSVLGLHHGIPGRCPTRNFNPEALIFEKSEARVDEERSDEERGDEDREVEKQLNLHGRRGKERMITTVLGKETAYALHV